MRDSYVGIVDSSGLRWLVPETEHAARFLVWRAGRCRGCCFWAVIDDSLAVAIELELERGQAANALQLLQLFAVDLGPILPDTYDSEKLTSTG